MPVSGRGGWIQDEIAVRWADDAYSIVCRRCGGDVCIGFQYIPLFGGVTFGNPCNDHVGFVALFPETRLVADTLDSPALETVRDLLQEWKGTGRPRIEDLTAHSVIVADEWTLDLTTCPNLMSNYRKPETGDTGTNHPG